MTKQRIQLILGFLAVIALGLIVLLALTAQNPGGVKFVTPEGGAECLIVNRNSNRCLCAERGVVKPGAKIVQGPAPENAKSSEHWVLKQSGSGYKVVHKDSGYVLEVAGAKKERGGVAMLWTNSGDVPHQTWAFVPIGASYALRAGHSGFYLAVAQSSTKEGGVVLQWDRIEAADDQLWFLLPPPQ